MTAAAPPSVSVVITAFDAAATVGDAVRTALAEPEVAEVIVVDDASRDATLEAAEEAAAGDKRLKLIRCARNGGPAAARNHALEVAGGEFVAVLDADDFLLPGRFSRLLALPGRDVGAEAWDMVADNILFVPEAAGPGELPPIPPVPTGPIDIDLTGFVRANLTVRGANRREWGFLKPLIRIGFLRDHGLRYDETLRLGEDYDLYVRMLQAGARFRVTPEVGYAARWRSDSLSSRHRTADLAALEKATAAHLAAHLAGPNPDGEAGAALRAHHAQTRHRLLLRDFLDRRAAVGRAGAVLTALRAPSTLAPIARGVLADKVAGRRKEAGAPATRIGRVLIES